MKIICKRKRARLTIMKLLSLAKGLPQAMQFQSISLEVEREERLHMLQTLFQERNLEETSVNSTGCEKSASRAASKRFIPNNA